MGNQRTNPEWIQDLSSSGERQRAALEELHPILLRAARYTFQRHLGELPQFTQLEVEQLAEDCAQDALLAILEHLPEFRGESKFTTWAYKFPVNIALTVARRERWKGVSLDELEDFSPQTGWPSNASLEPEPDQAAMRRELWELIQTVIREELTPRQRQVLKWMVFDEVPMDVVVQRLDTNRNTVYKILHDARSKLKHSLLGRGIGVDESLDLFRAKE